MKHIEDSEGNQVIAVGADATDICAVRSQKYLSNERTGKRLSIPEYGRHKSLNKFTGMTVYTLNDHVCNLRKNTDSFTRTFQPI